MKTTSLIVALLCLLWLSACQAESQVAPTSIAAGSSVAPPGTLEVTYLANEGFMIAGGGRKVLIDALFGEGLDGYAVVSPAQRALLEQARAPFADVDAVFATHFHDDHFNAGSVLAHLTHNPQAFFFSTPQAADRLKATGQFDAVKSRVVATLPKEGERIHSGHRGLHVQLLNIHHGRTRPIENLGFIIEIAGKRILHIGDSEAELAVFQKYEVVKDRIDVAFLPFWYFLQQFSIRKSFELQTVKKSEVTIQTIHGRKLEHPEQTAAQFPDFGLRPQAAPDLTKDQAAPLLDLIDQKGQQH